MSRGIVMETGSKHVIVLMPDGQFRKVRTALKPGIGEEFTFSEQRRMQRPRRLYSFSVGAAAIMLLLFVPVIAQHFSHPSSVVAYLTMDVNPSIELGIDKNERVEELRPINTDGEDVTKGLKFKGQPLQSVTEAIMDRISAGPYLNSGEGDVVITSVAVGAQVKPAEEVSLTSHMDDAVRKSLSKTEKGRQLAVEVTTVSAPKGIRDEAKRAGISSGKMAFYLMAKEQGYRISIKDLKQESIHQAAKAMGGVAAVMKSQESNAKVSKPAGSAPTKAQTATPQQTVKPQTVKPQTSKPPASKETDNEQLWEKQKQKQQLEDLLKKEQAKHSKWTGAKKGSGNDKSGSDNDRTLQQGGVINVSGHSPGNNTGDSSSGGAAGGQGGGSSSSQGKGSSSSHGITGINGQKNGFDDDRSQGNMSGKGGAGSQGSGGSNGKNGFGSVPWSKPKAPSKQQSQTDSKSSGSISGNKGSDDKAEGGREEAKNASDSRHSGVNQGKENQSATREDSSRDFGWDKSDDRDNGNDKDNYKDTEKEKGKITDTDKEKGSEKDTGKGNDKGKSQAKDSGKNRGNR